MIDYLLCSISTIAALWLLNHVHFVVRWWRTLFIPYETALDLGVLGLFYYFFLLPICNFFGIIIPLIVGYNLTCTGHRIFLLTCQNGLISLGKLSIHLGDYTTWRSLMIRLSVLNMHVILARNILDKILKLLSAWSCDVQP